MKKKEKIVVGSIVAFNKLLDTVWFDVISVNQSNMLTVQEHNTNHAEQYIDKGSVVQVKAGEDFTANFGPRFLIDQEGSSSLVFYTCRECFVPIQEHNRTAHARWHRAEKTMDYEEIDKRNESTV